MRIRGMKLKAAIGAAALVTLLVLPGEAKPVMQDAAITQAAFGVLADPHLAPALTVELPGAYWTL